MKNGKIERTKTIFSTYKAIYKKYILKNIYKKFI